MLRIHPTLVAICVWQTLVATSAPGQAPNADYIKQMPSFEQIKTVIKGSSALDTAARQLGVLWQLQDLIDAMAGKRHRQLTTEEKSLSAAYLKAFVAIREPIDRSLADAEQRRFYSLHVRYQQDKRLRDETLARLVPDAARREIYETLGEPLPKFADIEPQTDSAPEAVPPGNVGSLIIEGQRLKKAKDYEKALRMFARAAELDPDNPLAAAGVANCYYGLKQWERAAAAYVKLGKLMKGTMNADGWALMGDAQLHIGHSDLALDALQQALGRPHNAETGSFVENSIGQAYLAQKKPTEAVAAFREAVRLLPNNADADSGLGKAYIALNHVPEALTSYQEAVRLNPNDGDSYLQIGLIYRSQEQYAKAVDPLRRAVQLDPRSPDANTSLGLALYFSKQYADAAAALEKAVKLSPKEANSHAMLMMTYAQLGRQEDARREYGVLQQLDPAAAEQLKDVLK